MQQIPLAIVPDPQPSFDNFVVGSNGAAHAHLASPDLAAAPVYLWGPPGAGKTHLLRALADRIRRAGGKVGWFDADVPPPWEIPSGCRLLVIDRCDELDAAAQQAAFALFIEAAGEGMPVAAAGLLPPVDLPVREDLRTRLGWGPVFALEPLDDDGIRGALRREARRRGIELPDEVLEHLLTRFPRDLRHLMALLDRIDGYALARSRAVTVPLLRTMLGESATVEGRAT
jgi:DnaA family protein